MRHTIFHYSAKILAALCILTIVAACEEKESELGSSLVDPATLYNGTRDTVYLEGYTVYDDSLLTSDYLDCLIGRYDDATMGTTRAYLYAQITVSDNNGLNVLDGTEVDSVALSLSISEIHTSSTATSHTLHVKIHQLAEAIGDDPYYANDTLTTDYSTCFYDGTVNVENDAKEIRLLLNNTIYPYMGQQISSSDFLNNIKGVRIEMNDSESDEAVMVTINMVTTKLTAYYSRRIDDDSVATTQYSFIFGHQSGLTTRHFTHFKHNFEGSSLARFATQEGRNDTIGGNAGTYLKPMGGTRVIYKLNTAWYRKFRSEHPYAVLNYAELLLPVASGDTTTLPTRLLAYKGTGRNATLVGDATDGSRYTGFDGYFNSEQKYYRTRIVRHLQQILSTDSDPGTTLAIDARRSSPKSATIKGNSQADRPRIALIYSE
ncbi:MAG: DUF4270 family protein [Bacteroidales bacterium]|nr:DUF4270 family protein [Bacteroidales bacterium]